MYYTISVKHTIVDKKGNDKEVKENFICVDCELFAEAEHKGLERFNGDCDVVAIRQSAIKEVVNEPTDKEDEAIYLATIVSTFVTDNGDEKKTKHKVAFYALSVTNANKIIQDYMAQGLDDMECEVIEKTNFVEII